MIDINLKHILCPVDFSECSQQAFDQAVASRAGVALTSPFSTSCRYPVRFRRCRTAQRPRPIRFRNGHSRAGARGTEAVSRDGGWGWVPVHYETVESSNVYREILQQASVTAANLVVMGTHGRSGFDRLVLGSVAEKTLRTSPVPVLVVPPFDPGGVACCPRAGPFGSLCRRFLAGLRTGGRIRGLHRSATRPAGSRCCTWWSRCRSATTRRAARVSTWRDISAAWRNLAWHNCRSSYPTGAELGCEVEAIVSRGKAYQEILRVATERQADLIVLGVHGRHALDRLVFGSTAEHLVRRSTCPVLAVPPPAS